MVDVSMNTDGMVPEPACALDKAGMGSRAWAWVAEDGG